MHIEFESPDQPDVRALIAELDAYLYAIYPAESVYALDIASLCEPNVSFAMLRDAAGAPVGCGALVMKPGYGEIKRVYVRPQARGRGLARRLMAALEAKAIEHAARTCMLETGPAQAEALVLYERLGYRCRGPFGDYPADPHSVFMEKNVGEDAAT
ncbi:MAG: GNAT family N-acetyltransferase [Oxalobacteraceae bacterium]|nr:MAG: GNAT family N-acetyltransferase [Oxalobacteraceae bacterium]